MTGPARVTSIDALRLARAAVKRFIDEAAAALTEAESDAQKTEQWLRFERLGYWQAQLRSRADEVEAAKAALRRKQLTAIPETPTAIDERKAVDRAVRRVREAEEKVKHVKHWSATLDREHTLYKGQVQPLAEFITRDLEAASMRLDRLIASLESYASLTTGSLDATSGLAAAAKASPIDPAVVAARIAQLRRRSPRKAVREALPTLPFRYPAHEPAFVHGPPGGLMAHLGVASEEPGSAERVVIELGTLDAPSFFAERLIAETLGPGDSGWFIGDATPGVPLGELAAFTIGELRAARPALVEMLSLPRGFLVVVSADSIAAVLDAADVALVW